jgi:hypothetical protein
VDLFTRGVVHMVRNSPTPQTEVAVISPGSKYSA